jgi:NAD(P)-dependent dehydrogenase (short-subunit alcohol dehydrogenase family)
MRLAITIALDHKQNLTTEEIKNLIEAINSLNEDAKKLAKLSHEEREALLMAAGKLSRPTRDQQRIRHKEIAREIKLKTILKDRKARSETGIRKARENTVFEAPKQLTSTTTQEQVLEFYRNCYVCKAEFNTLHFFYDTMCKSCGDFNYQKRFQTADMTGQVAIITGARLKIGYHCALMMLKSGAKVIVTTRFPVDAAVRFSKEEDYHIWKDRLHIYGLDLRHTPSVEIFARYMEQTLDRLDILINNAAQTVRRPPGFYAHLMEMEKTSFDNLKPEVQHLLASHENCKAQLNLLIAKDNNEGSMPVTWSASMKPAIGLSSSAELSQIPYNYDHSLRVEEIFPEGKLDADLQQVDLRTTNSWRLKLQDVEIPEMVEVQLVNAIAPFVLCSKLAPLMRRDNTGQKHIVNVTAMEGKFYRFKKEDRHPHTNMAKAALNMLTHTSASDLAKDGIFMNAVDTGWVTDEDPATLAKHKQTVHDFQPPLDIVDGAARVCDPFLHGILTGHHWCGKFLKDYQPIDW